jgi:hypothetical protein
MSKNPANRTALDHVKQGLKQIPKTYAGLYNRPAGPGGGASTIPSNLRVIVKGNTSPGMPKIPGATRAKVVAMGAASVTPAGPIAAFAIGVNKSKQAKATAKANIAAAKAARAAGPAAAPAAKNIALKVKQPGGPAIPKGGMPPLPKTPGAPSPRPGLKKM